MDRQHFDQRIKGVREMKRHMGGSSVRGVRVTELDEPDVRAIRKTANSSQSQFAKMIGVNVRTLQNWEQRRTRPTGSAHALLKIVASIRGRSKPYIVKVRGQVGRALVPHYALLLTRPGDRAVRILIAAMNGKTRKHFRERVFSPFS